MRIFVSAITALLLLVATVDSSAQVCPPTVDCNANGQADSCDISQGLSDDCNFNGIPDECDLNAVLNADCNMNGILDICEPVPPVQLIGGAATSNSTMNGNWMLVADPAEPPPADEPPPLPGEIHPPVVRIVEVFKRVGTRWLLDGYLVPNDPTDQDNLDGFAFSMAISGDTAVIGAPMGNGHTGKAYVFQRTENGWIEAQVLQAELPTFGALYGFSVDIMGSDIVIGAPQAPLGDDGDDDADPIGPTPGGYAEIWSQTGTGWERATRLAPTNPVTGGGEEIGTSVAFASDGWVFLGAPAAGGTSSGHVFGFRNFGGGWVLMETLQAFDSTQGHRFGTQIAVSGDTMVVGAERAPAGLNAGPVGAVYTFDRSAGGGDWIAGGRTVSSTPDTNGYADSLAMTGDLMVVGEPRADATRGFAHVYNRADDGSWTLMDSIRPVGTVSGNAIGSSVATDGEWIFYSAPEVIAFTEFREITPDCNANGFDDRCEINSGLESDCNGNMLIDSCETLSGAEEDCDANGIPDSCELASGAFDCNNNGILDSCDISGALSLDCNANGIPDDCEDDCNGNGIPDSCDLLAGAQDCNANGIIDSCDIASQIAADCDGNGTPDSCDLLSGAGDCNANGLIDSCEIATTSGDCDNDGQLDACQLVNQPALDCNNNFELDTCDLASGLSFDCDNNSVPDECQLFTGFSKDCNSNGIPDECESGEAVDTNPPTFVTTVADIIKSTEQGSCSAAASWIAAVAEDDCSPPPMVSSSHINGGTFPLGVTEVTLTATDDYGNSSTSTFTVTVLDNENPTISGLPLDFTVTNDPGQCGAEVNWTEPSFADNCSVSSTGSDISNGSILAVGTHTITYTGTDSAGLTVSDSFEVTVLDDELPEFLNPPANASVTTDPNQCGAIVSWDPVQVSDNCSIISSTSSHGSGSFFDKGETVVTMMIIDSSSNQRTHSFTVSVTDDQAPTLSGLSGDISMTSDQGMCGAVVTWTSPNTIDNCPNEMLTSNANSGDYFEVGTHTVTYTVMDTSGLSLSASFNVTITDNEAPQFLTTPMSQTLSTDPGSCTTTAQWDVPEQSDNCGIQSLESTAQSGDTFEVGTTPVTMTLKDIHGNETLHQFEITVIDEEAPEILGLPADIQISNDLNNCGAIVSWTEPDLSDNCAGASIQSDRISGEYFTLGSHTVTYTATDAHGSSVSSSFVITITDDQDPSFDTAPQNMVTTSEAGLCGAQVFWDVPLLSDNCSILSFVSTWQSGAVFPVGETTVSMVLTDVHLNISNHTFTVTVIDNEAPALLDMPSEMVVSTTEGQCSASVSWTPPTASDNCEVSELVCSHENGAVFDLGSTLVTYTTTDSASNSTQQSFLVTVVDDQAPQFLEAPGDMTLSSSAGLCSAVAAWTTPLVSDNCGETTLSVSQQSGTMFSVGSTFVTMFLSDNSGNSTQHSFTVTVIDSEAPILSGIPTDMTLSSDLGQCGATANWQLPVGTDNCGLGDLLGSHQPGQFFPLGTTTVSYSQADSNGNLATGSFLITVIDNEAPVITGADDVFIDAPDSVCSADVTIPMPQAFDNCNVASLTNDISGEGPITENFTYGLTLVTWTATDFDGNSTSVEQEINILVPLDDCNNNGTPDVCELEAGTAEDCDGNGVPDSCDLASGTGQDCNNSGVLDSCEVASGAAQDCDGNGSPDECDIDCNGNGSPDACDIDGGSSLDCNANGTPDECDLIAGTSVDSNGDDTPDECEVHFRRGDANEDGSVDIGDAIFMLYTLMLGGPDSGCKDATDANDSGTHDIADIIYILNYQFTGGAEPPAPGISECGVDATPNDGLGCNSYGGCP